MTKHLARYLAALAFLVFLPGLAWAQSSPGLYNGQVPTAAQWNQYFQKKADWPIGGFCADGSIYANFTGVTNSLRCTPYTGVPAASAAKWTTARTLTVTGDLSLTIAGIDGSANFTGAATLPTVNGNVGSFTCTNFTVNAKGLITAASSGSCAVGTVTTTGSPSSGQMAKFSGATSITTAVAGTDYAPATSGTSILKASAGGFANAVSGTDYAPATSGSALLKGNGAGGFSSAASGTDYAPATSGSAILKGNGSGGFSAAVSGTDYAPATSGSSILAGNGAGGHTNISVANGLTFTGGNTLTAPAGSLVNVRHITATGAFTYTPTAGTNSVIIELLAGGGGGSGVGSPTGSNVYIGAGGCSGGWLRVRLTANFSGATGSVGAKGGGGAAGLNAGGTAGDTTFTTTGAITYTAKGGVGAGYNGPFAAPFVAGLAGCVGTTGGDDALSGQAGSVPLAVSVNNNIGGSGGSSPYGLGGIPRVLGGTNTSVAGAAAAGKGAGGSGAVATGTGAAAAGGDGTDGEVTIYEFN